MREWMRFIHLFEGQREHSYPRNFKGLARLGRPRRIPVMSTTSQWCQRQAILASGPDLGISSISWREMETMYFGPSDDTSGLWFMLTRSVQPAPTLLIHRSLSCGDHVLHLACVLWQNLCISMQGYLMHDCIEDFFFFFGHWIARCTNLLAY